MLESCFDAIIWYVFDGAQRQISKFLFSIIMPRTQYFQGSSRQQLEKCLVYSIFYAFHLGTSLGKRAFSPNWYLWHQQKDNNDDPYY
jgi:hypothetical protein